LVGVLWHSKSSKIFFVRSSTLMVSNRNWETDLWMASIAD
jgi:hypothetical protein